jgi:alkylation response protein AidB-like acyl-CoA dehydrogenase
MSFDFRAAAESVASVAREHAAAVDAHGTFPQTAIETARKAGLFGLLSRPDVGGHGLPLRAAGAVVERVARECGSTAMVLTMHWCGAAVLEAFGDRTVRADVAAGRHLSTLAFSEAGSRSHFWAPTSTAKLAGKEVVLDAQKSWITSANQATAYVWSSRPVAGSEASTLWLVPRTTPGLRAAGVFDGLGLRGNDSAPVAATGVHVPLANRLGEDGAGFGIMMGTVLPAFAMLIAGGSLGLAEGLVQKTAAHAQRHALRPSPQPERARRPADDPRPRRAHAHPGRPGQGIVAGDVHGDGEPGAPTRVCVCSRPRPRAGEAAGAVGDLAMRVCGGMAFRKEVGVERLFRDSRAATDHGSHERPVCSTSSARRCAACPCSAETLPWTTP